LGAGGRFDYESFDPSERESLNTGIALVTPITDALEVLLSADFADERRAARL
jgi:hypothetical protein